MSTLTITAKWHGQLANQLFIYCAVRHFAEQYNAQWHLPQESWVGNKIVDINFGIPALPKIEGHNDILILDGYYQSPKYINDKWIERYPNTKYLEFIDIYPPNKYCYIHFRGTDLRYTLDKKYFDHAKRKITEITNIDKFLCITDDVKKAPSYIDKGIDIINNDTLTDMWILGSAKYLIIPNSTFSWFCKRLGNSCQVCIAPGDYEPTFIRHEDEQMHYLKFE